MKTLTLIAAILLMLFQSGCSKTNHASTYGSDNKWWKCNIDPSKGCEGGDLKNLGLTEAEQKYVVETLDRAPWTPSSATAESVISHFAEKPSINVGSKLIFEKDAHGLCTGCATSVYLFRGRISMIHYFVPRKFLLVRHDPSVDK